MTNEITDQEKISKEAAQLARDLDKSPTGEQVLERLLTGMILLKRENAELKAKLDKVCDQMLVLTNLVDSDHAALMVLMGQRHAVAEGIVN
jgi:hypothetical protein